jgi:chromate transport protein ChrA
MDGNKKGVSVKEIEEFTKKHRYEVFFCALFVLTCIFSIFGHFGGGWSIFFAMGGAVIGIIFPNQVESFLRTVFKFIFKQDKTIQIVLGAVALILAIFLPFVIFGVLGLIGGRVMNIMAMDSSK